MPMLPADMITHDADAAIDAFRCYADADAMIRRHAAMPMMIAYALRYRC